MDDNLDVEGEGEEKQKFELLDEDMMDQVKKWFDSFDKDKDGQIQTSELGTILRILDFNPTEKELQDMINEVDPTRTALVDLNTVNKLVERKLHDTDTIEELVEALKWFDGDKDGKIQVWDLRWAMTQLGEKMDDTMWDDLITEADSAKEGYIDIMTFAKLLKGIK